MTLTISQITDHALLKLSTTRWPIRKESWLYVYELRSHLQGNEDHVKSRSKYDLLAFLIVLMCHVSKFHELLKLLIY